MSLQTTSTMKDFQGFGFLGIPVDNCNRLSQAPEFLAVPLIKGTYGLAAEVAESVEDTEHRFPGALISTVSSRGANQGTAQIIMQRETAASMLAPLAVLSTGNPPFSGLRRFFAPHVAGKGLDQVVGYDQVGVLPSSFSVTIDKTQTGGALAPQLGGYVNDDAPVQLSEMNTIGARTDLTANASPGDLSIAVTSAAGMLPGHAIRILDTDGTGEGLILQGCVDRIEGTTVHLSRGLVAVAGSGSQVDSASSAVYVAGRDFRGHESAVLTSAVTTASTSMEVEDADGYAPGMTLVITSDDKANVLEALVSAVNLGTDVVSFAGTPTQVKGGDAPVGSRVKIKGADGHTQPLSSASVSSGDTSISVPFSRGYTVGDELLIADAAGANVLSGVVEAKPDGTTLTVSALVQIKGSNVTSGDGRVLYLTPPIPEFPDENAYSANGVAVEIQFADDSGEFADWGRGRDDVDQASMNLDRAPSLSGFSPDASKASRDQTWTQAEATSPNQQQSLTLAYRDSSILLKKSSRQGIQARLRYYAIAQNPGATSTTTGSVAKGTNITVTVVDGSKFITGQYVQLDDGQAVAVAKLTNVSGNDLTLDRVETAILSGAAVNNTAWEVTFPLGSVSITGPTAANGKMTLGLTFTPKIDVSAFENPNLADVVRVKAYNHIGALAA